MIDKDSLISVKFTLSIPHRGEVLKTVHHLYFDEMEQAINFVSRMRRYGNKFTFVELRFGLDTTPPDEYVANEFERYAA